MFLDDSIEWVKRHQDDIAVFSMFVGGLLQVIHLSPDASSAFLFTGAFIFKLKKPTNVQ